MGYGKMENCVCSRRCQMISGHLSNIFLPGLVYFTVSSNQLHSIIMLLLVALCCSQYIPYPYLCVPGRRKTNGIS